MGESAWLRAMLITVWSLGSSIIDHKQKVLKMSFVRLHPIDLLSQKYGGWDWAVCTLSLE